MKLEVLKLFIFPVVMQAAGVLAQVEREKHKRDHTTVCVLNHTSILT